jgi:hypothetical protein
MVPLFFCYSLHLCLNCRRVERKEDGRPWLCAIVSLRRRKCCEVKITFEETNMKKMKKIKNETQMIYE